MSRPAAAIVAAAGVAGAVGAWIGVHCTAHAVRTWRAGSGDVSRRGLLAARLLEAPAPHGVAQQLRDAGQDDPVIVLVSGLASSERYWGSAFDALAALGPVIAVDPPGFGSSFPIVDARDRTDPATHVAMLDELLAERGLTGRSVVIVGHSMGASLALRWAASSEKVRAVVCFGAPLYRDDAEVTERMRHLGWFESLLARGPLAERVCHWMCRHRDQAQWLAVVARPGMPTPIARDGVMHTWPGYIGAFTALIADPGWEPALDELGRRGIPVDLVYGTRDGVPVPGRAHRCAAEWPSVTLRTLDGGHDLPLVRAAECVEVIAAAAARVRVNAA